MFPWIRFIGLRVVRGATVMGIVAVLSFFMLRAAPGGPFSDDRGLPPAILKNLEARYHLDEPMAMQMIRHLWALLHGDLGPSFRQADFSVNDLLAAGLPATALLGLFALSFALLAGVPLGALAAARPGGIIYYITKVITIGGVAVPNFVLGPLLVAVFSLTLKWFEPGGFEDLRDLVLPSIALGAGPLAIVARLTQSGLRDVFNQDFIKAARARGIPPRQLLFRHALRGALAPVLTYLGPACAAVLTGSLVVESVFSIPGIGGYLVRGATNRDYSVVLGVVLLGTLVLIIANTFVDILYAVLDPRIRDN